jgi:hypothetical protein
VLSVRWFYRSRRGISLLFSVICASHLPSCQSVCLSSSLAGEVIGAIRTLLTKSIEKMILLVDMVKDMWVRTRRFCSRAVFELWSSYHHPPLKTNI